ncbi:hypothetical protein UPYG_G00064840, partial [Umbra pygmaea]
TILLVTPLTVTVDQLQDDQHFRNCYTREWSSNRPLILLFGFETRLKHICCLLQGPASSTAE